MIDYHYCSKVLSDYPKNDQKEIAMIRICSRKEDIPKSIEICRTTKEIFEIECEF